MSDEHTSGNRWEPQPDRPDDASSVPGTQSEDTAPLLPPYAEPTRPLPVARRRLSSSALKVAAAAVVILLAGGTGGFAVGRALSDNGSTTVGPGAGQPGGAATSGGDGLGDDDHGSGDHDHDDSEHHDQDDDGSGT